jgi:Asp-tRNA(Asn)/Glu-tRNA(Gln) amidotransferase A subunit family amidase
LVDPNLLAGPSRPALFDAGRGECPGDATRARDRLEPVLRQVRPALSPAVAVQPFEVGKNLPDGPHGTPNSQWSPYTPQFNLTRHPAATVPCGLGSEGLPVGLQIVSGHYKDALVLRAAARYAEAHPLKFPLLPETKE